MVFQLTSGSGRFEVRLAQSDAEIASAQRLRYSVFVEEMGASAAQADHEQRLECDDFDPFFDHLILLDNERSVEDPLDRVIGVYRLMRKEVALAGPGFYGADEYDLLLLEQSPRRMVELGRSCVASDYRKGAAMHLMWGGLADYVLSHDIEVMFGVASFHGVDPDAIAQALSFLHHQHLAPADIRVRARDAHFQKMDLLEADRVDPMAARKQIPALIKAYLRLGGFVGEGAYIDRNFNTIDVCLLMDTARMSERHRSFYTRAQGPR